MKEWFRKIDILEKKLSSMFFNRVVRMIIKDTDGSIVSDTGEENATDTITINCVSPQGTYT